MRRSSPYAALWSPVFPSGPLANIGTEICSRTDMLYPNLLIAIRRSGLRQYHVAHRAGIRETRLSRILRDTPATANERLALATALSTPPEDLFDRALAAGDTSPP